MTLTELNQFEDNLPKHLTPLQEMEASMEYNRTGNKSGWWDNVPIPDGWVEGQVEPRPKGITKYPNKTRDGCPPSIPRFFNCRSR